MATRHVTLKNAQNLQYPPKRTKALICVIGLRQIVRYDAMVRSGEGGAGGGHLNFSTLKTNFVGNGGNKFPILIKFILFQFFAYGVLVAYYKITGVIPK